MARRCAALAEISLLYEKPTAATQAGIAAPRHHEGPVCTSHGDALIPAGVSLSHTAGLWLFRDTGPFISHHFEQRSPFVCNGEEVRLSQISAILRVPELPAAWSFTRLIKRFTDNRYRKVHIYYPLSVIGEPISVGRSSPIAQ
jgi:hypothetical protein